MPAATGGKKGAVALAFSPARIWGALGRVVRTEGGVRALWQGWRASTVRLLPMVMLVLPLRDVMRAALGLAVNQ